jgi:hypothetical protein
LIDIGIISISVEGEKMICNLRGLKGWEIDFGSKAIKWNVLVQIVIDKDFGHLL